MKKIILSAITLLVICFSANAQDTIIYRPKPVTPIGEKNRLNIYGAYVFDDNVNSTYDSYNYFEGTIRGGLQYGAGMEFMVHETYGIELLYIGQQTTVPLHYAFNYAARDNDVELNLNYAMLAFGRHMMRPGSKLEGYGGLMLGALFANAYNPEGGTEIDGTKFAWGLRLGGNMWASNKIGIKIQAQVLSAVQAAGGGLYFGTGGAGAGVSTYSSMFQFSIGGGLVFALGK